VLTCAHNRFYVISEFIGGGTLTEGLSKSPKLNTTSLLPLMLQIAEGIDYLHNGLTDTLGAVVHDDLNPQQILFSGEKVY